MENDTQTAAIDGWRSSCLFMLPFPVAILLLCFRRTRQAGAGFVMGLAIGALVLAGLCTSMLLPGLTG